MSATIEFTPQALPDREFGEDLNPSHAVQGFGNAGAIAARLFAEKGAKIIAASDSRGGVFAAEGLELPRLLAHKRETESVAGLPGASPLTNKDLLALECDILIPAALENVITAANAAQVRARIVVEAANGPTTPADDETLAATDVFVLPDILAVSRVAEATVMRGFA
jgi:glutamate dehydrogenase/leucine dehydrogenase